MVAKVLGKVTHEHDVPRGPDAKHRITVAEEWLEDGATVEFELPRNLTCAACDGGGCDACGRSGALSTRGRKELPEVVQVTLPTRSADDDPPSSGKRGIVIRVPERGGLPEGDDETLQRGHLMLAVRVGTLDDATAERVRLSIAPLAPIGEEPAEEEEREPARGGVVLVAIIMVVIAVTVWWLTR